MSHAELICRSLILHDKLYISCFALYDSLHRFGKEFDNMKRCIAYEKALKHVYSKIDEMESEF